MVFNRRLKGLADHQYRDFYCMAYCIYCCAEYQVFEELVPVSAHHQHIGALLQYQFGKVSSG